MPPRRNRRQSKNLTGWGGPTPIEISDGGAMAGLAPLDPPLHTTTMRKVQGHGIFRIQYLAGGAVGLCFYSSLQDREITILLFSFEDSLIL